MQRHTCTHQRPARSATRAGAHLGVQRVAQRPLQREPQERGHQLRPGQALVYHVAPARQQQRDHRGRPHAVAAYRRLRGHRWGGKGGCVWWLWVLMAPPPHHTPINTARHPQNTWVCGEGRAASALNTQVCGGAQAAAAPRPQQPPCSRTCRNLLLCTPTSGGSRSMDSCSAGKWSRHACTWLPGCSSSSCKQAVRQGVG